jgi:hypothetical protein
MAASSIPSQVPKAGGQKETLRASGLVPNTMYWFAVRARDAAGNLSDLSNVASGTTKPRAAFLITEVAPLNGPADGYDFVEIVATTAGSAKGIEIRQESGVLHTLADIDVAVGDRFVVHATGLPGPAGFAQEDTPKNKTASTAAFTPDAGPAVPVHSVDAFDLYSAVVGLTGTDNVISVVDTGKTIDAIAFSERDSTASTAAMVAFAKARTDMAWTFTAAPVDGVNDCETQAEAVGISAVDTQCGGFRTGVDNGFSINRNALLDTNTRRDFYVAAQTPGSPNGAIPAPNVLSALGTSATTVDVRFDQEILAASAAAGNFAISPALNVTATASSSNVVTLTTDAQSAGTAYGVTASNAVTNYHGTGVASGTARFCGFSATGASLVINEVAPNQASSADLVELRVLIGGALAGFTLRLNPTMASGGTTLATLPTICAVTDDIVVVHLTPPAGAGPASETLAKNEHPNATFSANYDAAWDVNGTNNGIPFQNADAVLAVRTAGGTYQDAVAFMDGSGNVTNTVRDSLLFFQGNGLWLPPNCAGVACDNATAETVMANFSGATGTTPAADSMRRTDPAMRQASAWALGLSSFGLPNP